METFRCPTCIAILPDAHVRRCSYCGQALRRRHPRVLGDEHRIGARTLPVDRWMLDLLQGEPRRRRAGGASSVPWHGRFAPSPRSAEPDLVMPPVTEPPMGAAAIAAAAAASAAPVVEPPAAEAPAVEAIVVDSGPATDAPSFTEVEETPAAITARDLDLFVAPTPPAPAPPAPVEQPVEQPVEEPVAEVAVAPAPPVVVTPPIVATPPASPPPPAPQVAAHPVATPFPTPRPIVAHEELDPEVRALVDELYEQARAELSGIDPLSATNDTPSASDGNESQPRSNGGGWSQA